MEEIQFVQKAPPLNFALDTYLADCVDAGTLRNDAWSTLKLVLEFQSHYLHSLEALHYQLVARFLRHASSNTAMERYGPRFSNIMVAINKQYEKVLHRFQVLHETYLENALPPATAASSTTPPAASATSPLSSTPSPASPSAAPPVPPRRRRLGWERALARGDLEDYFRYTLPRVQTRLKSSRFLLKLRWLPSTHDRDLIDSSSTGLWSSTRDLSVPPNWKSPRSIDLLPGGLVRVDEVEAENRRMRRLWRREASGVREEEGDDGLDWQAEREQEAASHFNPFAATFASASVPSQATPSMTASSGSSSLPSSSSSRISLAPSIFDCVSRSFPKIWSAQSAAYCIFTDSSSGGASTGAMLEEYEVLLDERDRREQAELERSYAEMTPSEIAKHQALRSKRALEQRRQEAERARIDAVNEAAAVSTSTARPLRDTSAPVISTTGKIWGGKAINNFSIKDDREVEMVLREAEAAQGGAITSAAASTTAGSSSHDPKSASYHTKKEVASASNHLSAPVFAREEKDEVPGQWTEARRRADGCFARA
jgi:hypothetical protein